MNETWREIKGYEHIYEVSTFGRVRRIADNHILRTETHYKGYQRVDLFKDGKRRHFKVHRLVAEAFIQNPDNRPQVNHRDFNKANNRVWNLEWATDEENKAYSRANAI